MRILLDTHIAIWAIIESERLSADLQDILEDMRNEVYYSIASVWEIAIKHLIHPEQMPLNEEEFVSLCDETGFQQLKIESRHIYSVKTLIRSANAQTHNDPFDRLLIAQAKSEDMNFFTHDKLLRDYNEKCITYL